MGKKSLSRSKLKVKPSVGDFNQTVYNNSRTSFRIGDSKRIKSGEDRDRLKDVKPQFEGGAPAVNIK